VVTLIVLMRRLVVVMLSRSVVGSSSKMMLGSRMLGRCHFHGFLREFRVAAMTYRHVQ
jgi:hypothetical protein